MIIVSPIVEGQALKGPTAKMMKELDIDCDVSGIVDFYADIADGIVIDNKDSELCGKNRIQRCQGAYK